MQNSGPHPNLPTILALAFNVLMITSHELIVPQMYANFYSTGTNTVYNKLARLVDQVITTLFYINTICTPHKFNTRPTSFYLR